MHMPDVALPSDWPKLTCSGVLRAIALAHWGMVWIQSWCVNSRLERVRLRGENERLRAEVALLEEELRIKDGRLARIPARNRPRYPAEERLSILALKAARSWSAAVTARHFLLTAPTVAEWCRRVESDGEPSLVRMAAPVNRFPDFVRDLVRRLRALVPAMGYEGIAASLAQAGLHLSASSARRFIHQPPEAAPDAPQPQPPQDTSRPEACDASDAASASSEPSGAGAVASDKSTSQRTVTARYPNHVWNCDLTMVPIMGGFWIPWLPLALVPKWPFCWWVGAVLDHYSRRIIAYRVFRQQPSAEQVVGLLEWARITSGFAPKHLVTDQGPQFKVEYQAWCKEHGVRPRYGAVGHHGSIAVIEPFWATLKGEGLRRLLVPIAFDAIQHEIGLIVDWYNTKRSHSSLGGATPHEVYFQIAKAREGPRFETRAKWPLGEGVTLRAEKGAVVELAVSYLEGRQHLPIVELKLVA